MKKTDSTRIKSYLNFKFQINCPDLKFILFCGILFLLALMNTRRASLPTFANELTAHFNMICLWKVMQALCVILFYLCVVHVNAFCIITVAMLFFEVNMLFIIMNHNFTFFFFFHYCEFFSFFVNFSVYKTTRAKSTESQFLFISFANLTNLIQAEKHTLISISPKQIKRNKFLVYFLIFIT